MLITNLKVLKKLKSDYISMQCFDFVLRTACSCTHHLVDHCNEKSKKEPSFSLNTEKKSLIWVPFGSCIFRKAIRYINGHFTLRGLAFSIYKHWKFSIYTSSIWHRITTFLPSSDIFCILKFAKLDKTLIL